MNTYELPSFLRKILRYRRRSRADFMLSKVNTRPGMNIIDVGCGIDGRSFDDYVPRDWRITGVDIHTEDEIHHNHPNFRFFHCDARNLEQFEDGHFDLAVSIGMLEHIADDDTYRAIASEIQRVARQYCVVVPYKYCWIEPHYGVPFFPLWPRSWQLGLIKALNLSGQRELIKQRPSFFDKNYRWRSNREYLATFSGAEIHLLPTLECIAIIKKAPLP